MRDFMLNNSLRGAGPVARVGGSTLQYEPLRMDNIRSAGDSSVSRTLRVTSVSPPGLRPRKPVSMLQTASLSGGAKSGATATAVKAAPTASSFAARVSSLPSGASDAAPVGYTAPLYDMPSRAPRTSSSPVDTANTMADDTMTAADTSGYIDAVDDSPPVIYGSGGGVTQNSALGDFWSRYKWWILSASGGSMLAVLFWMSRRRR